MSTLRLLMIPLILHLILNLTDRGFFLLIIVYLLTIMLDFFDGFLARKLNQESELGKILDPLADKLLVVAVLFALTVRSDFPVWLALLVIFRDLVILLASLLLFRGKGIIKSSILVGKVTFALLSVLIFFYIIDLHSGFNLLHLKRFLIAVSTTFLLWSWFAYCNVYRQEKQWLKRN